MKFEISKKIEDALSEAIASSEEEFNTVITRQLFEQLKSLIEKSRESENDAVRDLEIYVNEVRKILKEA